TVPFSDIPGEIRKKIRLLLGTQGFKITQWHRDIGGINSNSYGRFMKAKDKMDGAENGTYYSAYVRILEGKKKTPTRLRDEQEYPHGIPLERRARWVLGPK
ncbi:hypothetical protein C8J57DRAFT_1043438, partial [Mycena rebaudengoi]